MKTISRIDFQIETDPQFCKEIAYTDPETGDRFGIKAERSKTLASNYGDYLFLGWATSIIKKFDSEQNLYLLRNCIVRSCILQTREALKIGVYHHKIDIISGDIHISKAAHSVRPYLFNLGYLDTYINYQSTFNKNKWIITGSKDTLIKCGEGALMNIAGAEKKIKEILIPDNTLSTTVKFLVKRKLSQSDC